MSGLFHTLWPAPVAASALQIDQGCGVRFRFGCGPAGHVALRPARLPQSQAKCYLGVSGFSLLHLPVQERKIVGTLLWFQLIPITHQPEMTHPDVVNKGVHGLPGIKTQAFGVRWNK